MLNFFAQVLANWCPGQVLNGSFPTSPVDDLVGEGGSGVEAVKMSA